MQVRKALLASASTKKAVATTKAKKKCPRPTYAGYFDLFFAHGPGFEFACPSEDRTEKPDFQRVYNHIQYLQSRDWFSARIGLTATGDGRLGDPGFCDPIAGRIIRPICIVDRKPDDKVEFAAAEVLHPATAGTGPGFHASLVLAADQYNSEHTVAGSVAAGGGEFKLRKVWGNRKEDTELFEGFSSFLVVWTDDVRTKGYSATAGWKTCKFWAVRAGEGESTDGSDEFVVRKPVPENLAALITKLPDRAQIDREMDNG